MCLSNLFIFEGLIDAQGQMEFLDIQAVAGPPSLTRALGVPILGITWEYWVYIIQIRRCKRDIMGHIQRWNVFFSPASPNSKLIMQYAQRMEIPRYSWESRQEEYIKDEMKNLKREMIRAQEAACQEHGQERKNI